MEHKQNAPFFMVTFGNRWRCQKGFSLAEIVTVIAIVGILSAIAIPMIMKWMPNIRLRGAGQELFGDMHRAKTEAIKRSRNVVVQFNDVDCPGAPNAVPDVGGGYTIFIDDGVGGGVANNHIQDGSESTLLQRTMPRNVALCQPGFPGGWAGFLPTGLPVGSNIGSLTIRNDQGRSVIMTLTMAGGVRVN